jgi:hypothetical protein
MEDAAEAEHAQQEQMEKLKVLLTNKETEVSTESRLAELADQAMAAEVALKAAQQEETPFRKQRSSQAATPRVGTGVQCGGGHAAFVRAVDAEEKALNSERALMPSMWKCRWSRQ